MLPRLRSAVASTVSLVVCAALGTAVAPSAQAAATDAATVAVTGLFDRLANDFLPQMASSAALSRQLPTLAVTPAESVQLKTAFAKALGAGGPLADTGDQATLADLADYVDDADAAGWVFTSATPDDHSLTIGFTRTVTQDAGLDVRDQDGTLSLSSGKGIDVTGTLSGSFTFVYDAAAGQAVLTHPSMAIATSADLPGGKALDAGLGILGVRVTGTDDATDYRLQSNVTTSWANPDNDAAGSLAYDNAGTAAADDGELAAAGAGTGIVTTTRTGLLTGHLVAVPRANDRVAGLPSVGATVDLSSAAPASFDAPAVTAVVPTQAKPFLTMTPRDLATALSQAASAVLGMQDAQDGNLPLMRGTIGNAVDAVGGIKLFLSDQVPDADPDDQTPGQPKFASLQDMIVELDKASYVDSGWQIDVLGDPADATDKDAARYDPASKKVSFTLRATRGVTTPIELNLLGAATSGTANYSATGLSVTGDSASLPIGKELAGRKVTSGASFGTVADVPTATTLTLTGDGWVGGRPANGSAFAVEAADPKTGAPELADVLKAKTGIGTANAEVSTATVTPDVVLTLPMALDLSAPLTYAGDDTKLDCNPDPAVESPCPFQQVDSSGLARVITSLPLAADRVLFRQSPRTLLVADAAISSPVQIVTSSGFLGLSIDGNLELTQGTGEHLQRLALTKGTAAVPVDVPVPSFVEQVRQQAVRTSGSTDDVFSQTLEGAVKATIDVSVADTDDAFAAGESSTELTVTGTVAKLADGIQAGDVSVVAKDPARADLLRALNFEPDNPTSLFGGVREAFKSAGSDLTTMTGGGLDVPIPFVGSSVSQLIGAGASGAEGVKYAQVAGTVAVPATDTTPAVDAVPATTRLTDARQSFTRAFIGRQIVVGSTTATIVDQGEHTLTLAPQLGSAPADDTAYLVENELLGAVHVLTASTPTTLQDALAIAQSSLGNSSTIDFGLVDNGGAKLRLDLTWERKYGVSQPVSLEIGDQELGGASAGGELSLEASGTVKLRLLLPLTAAAMLNPIANTLIDKSGTAIDFGVKVDADAVHIGASIGPVSVDLGKAPSNLGSFHAGLGVNIAGKAAGATPTITDFLTGGFDVTVNNAQNDCDGDVVICADFPVFISNVQPPGGNLKITTTLGSGDLTALFSDTGTKVVLPSGLQKILDGEGFKFDSLAEGLQQYLFYSETALRTASNDGEMPVVGKDLQAGADFMGKAREKLDAMLAVADPTTVGGATDMLKAKLAEMGVVVDGSAGIDVNFTCTMALTPPSAAPTAVSSPTPAAAADTTQYVYKVVSTYKDSKNVTHDSIPSAQSEIVLNAAAISNSKFNKVSWAKVDVATGYTVLRAIKPTTGEPVFGVVGTVAGKDTVTYDDKTVTPDPATYTAETKAYSRIPGAACAPETPVLQIEGLVVDLQLGQGKVGAKGCEDDLKADGTLGKLGKCIDGELPVDLGIPGLSLKTGDGGSVKGSVGWNLDLSIGLSRSRGFYVNTNKVPGQPEFRVGASLGLTEVTGPELKAQLAIIDVDAETNSSKPEFVGQFGIDIKDDPNDGATDFDLTVAEMKRLRVKDVIVVTVRAEVDINWHLAASASAALPGISTDFRLTWGWGLTSGPPPPPTNKDDLKIAFNKVTLNTGEFFGQALNPYLKQVVDATKPLQPIIDTIFTPVPVISDLSKAAGGSEITIATLAEKFNTLPEGAKIQPFLKAIKLVKQLLAVKCDASCGIEIGSFELLKNRATTTTVSAGSATSMIDTKPVADGGTYAPKPKEATAAAIAGSDKSGQLATPGTISKVKSLTAGLSIPVMEDPTILFELISGGDIPLVEFDSGPLSLGFQFQKSFGPIYAPPPVMMVIGGGASVTLRIAAGFDTYGIRRAIETGDGAQVLDSLYFKTVDNNGVPIPVVQFTGYLEAGASVSIGILEVGVVGGIKLTVGFYWNDPNGDGKFRLFEFGAAVANNPICLFNVGGELSLYIKIFVEIGFSPFSVSFDFTLVNIKLLDFSFKPNCTPPPPRLGGTHDGVLYVFAGRFGGAGPRGNAAWDAKDKAETWAIRQVPEFTDEQGDKHDAAVEVRGIGLTESFSDKDEAIKTVVLDGRNYPGNLTVSFTGGSGTTANATRGAFTKTAVVFTGGGDDVIRTGEGDSWVDSGAGADNITTLDRADLDLPLSAATARVAGGPGADVITVGNGNDTVTGDGSITVTEADRTVELAPDNASDPHHTSLAGALDLASLKDSALTNLDTASIGDTDGNDQIAAGLGAVHLSGNGGVDTIGTANDSPLADSDGVRAGSTGGSADKEALYRAHDSVLVGGAGGDILKSGSANDKVFTGSHAVVDEFGDGSGDDGIDDANGIDRNTVDTGAGSDTVYGSNALDFVTTHSTPAQKAIIFGGAGADVLTGGLGSDEIYGGPGNDYVVAAPATVGELASAQDALGSARLVGVLPGAGSSPKKLVGGTGSDRIYGSDGTSAIFGDTTVDGCPVQGDPVSGQPAETTNAADAADLVLGGNGVDVVNAGGGNDWVYAAGASDRVCGNSGSDHLYAGDAADLVYGGSGGDEAYGDAGDDQVYGNDGADAVYGAAGADRLQGNRGDDRLFGGADADVLLGGTSKSGTPDGADSLFGAEGSDVLVGDNAQSDVAGASPYPTDLASSDAALGGDDYLVAGDDADRAYGGLEDDTISGGAADDYAEGNPGTDTVSGDAGDDDLVGGSSELASGLFTGSEPGRPDTGDVVSGGAGQDVIAGDNAVVTRGAVAHPLMAGRGLSMTRGVDLADESAGPATGLFGDDTIRGGADTDVVFAQRGNDDVGLGDAADYGEGGQGVDVVHGDAGDDDVVGGSYTSLAGTQPVVTGQPDGGDTLAGDAGQDVVLGDNGSLTRPVGSPTSPLTLNRVTAQRAVTPYDLGDSPVAGTSGADTITGDADSDVLLSQGGADSADGGSEADYVEGGQGSDLVLGGSDDDDVVGGSSAGSATTSTGEVGQPDGADDVYGGTGSDLVLGDNGLLTRPTSGRDWRTNRGNATQTGLVPARGVTQHDLVGPAPASGNGSHAGADALSGQAGVDVIFGQDGDDAISGGGDDDYVEGDGGADGMHGDVALTASEVVAAPAGSAWVTPAVDGAAVTAGQDDLAGGWARQGYRDGNDTIHGDGSDDFVVGDNGSIARVVDAGTTDRVYAQRYGPARTGSAKVRVAGGGASSTRFCPTTGATATSTCEVTGASGGDTVFGDDGQDVLYGQDGSDTIRGGAGDDDVYGELGADFLYGEDGEDAILGDRGGIQDRYETGARSTSTALNMPPAVPYTSRLSGSVSREADLLHDVNGTDFVGAATGAPMPLDGITFGGVDRIRGGEGHDSIHAGAGDDLVNGDAGGDAVFGDRGDDVLWGGAGRSCTYTDATCLADRGVGDQYVDHLFGGKGEDVIDWRPRGVYGTGPAFAGRTCSTTSVPLTSKQSGTTDPCSWFEMTNRADDDPAVPATLANNQHHQGVDWIYGGWDRDAMQGDLSENGPHTGDRLMDWNGVYNLYSHCNSAYGGFTDVRNSAPAVEDFLRKWATGAGAGQPGTTPAQADTTVAGSSAYDELALTYTSDNKDHAVGSPYPTSPGHFDDPNACAGY